MSFLKMKQNNWSWIIYNDNGKTEIISVELKNNKYYIEWEIKHNCERGKDSVNNKGEIEMIEASIC